MASGNITVSFDSESLKSLQDLADAFTQLATAFGVYAVTTSDAEPGWSGCSRCRGFFYLP